VKKRGGFKKKIKRKGKITEENVIVHPNPHLCPSAFDNALY
jgi:hypothetical protein